MGCLGTGLLGILINCYRKNALFPIVLLCDFHEYNPIIKGGLHVVSSHWPSVWPTISFTQILTAKLIPYIYRPLSSSSLSNPKI